MKLVEQQLDVGGNVVGDEDQGRPLGAGIRHAFRV
jgi:hypothetical protein